MQTCSYRAHNDGLFTEVAFRMDRGSEFECEFRARRIRVRGTSHTNRYSKNLNDRRASHRPVSHQPTSHKPASYRPAFHRPASHRSASQGVDLMGMHLVGMHLMRGSHRHAS